MTDVQRTVTKVLATQQDLLFGEGQVQQTRSGGVYVVDKIRGFYPCNSQAELDALDPEKFPKAALVTDTGVQFFKHNGTDYVALGLQTFVGTNAEIVTGTPGPGEFWFNATDGSVHVGDGVTPGGNVISIKQVDNVDTLKEQTYIAGSVVTTKGYYTAGDGGHTEYVIKTADQASTDGDIIDGYGNHTLANGNVAVIITNGLISALSYGVSKGFENNGLQLAAWLNSGKALYLPQGDYNLTEQVTVTSSDFTLVMDGFIVIDWELVGPNDVVSFSGDNIKSKLKSKAKDSAYVLANKATLQTYNVFSFSGDDCCCIYGESQNNPGFVISRGSNKKFDFINNYGFSIISGLVADSTDITLFHANDGEKCIVSGNKGYGFGHAILFGLSTNNSVIDGNNFWDCGNHCVYVSSGDKNVIANNLATGDYTDIKARGDENSLTGNTVLGGNLTLTNRVTDTGNGFALNSGVVEGNLVKCNRELTLPINVSFRTGFDGPARNLSVCNNVIDLENANCSNALFVVFQTLEDVLVNNNVVGGSQVTIADAIRVTSTAGVTPSECVRVSVCGNTAKSAGESAIQVCSYRGRISDNSVLCTGGSGSNSGAILAFIDESVMDGNTVESTGVGISGINQKAGDNNIITGNIVKTANGLNQILEAGASNVTANNKLL